MSQEIESRIVGCIAATTRYPVSILKAEADLENDLGIDSVKRLEIVVALEKEFGIELANQPRDESIRTIGDISSWVESFVAGDSGSVVTPGGTEVSDSSTARDSVPFEKQSDAKPGADSVSRMTEPSRSESSQDTLRGPRFADRNAPDDWSRSSSAANDAAATMGRSLAGKTAFVTGSGRGVGKVIARTLASRGATVIINSFHSRDQGDKTTQEINASGVRAIHAWRSVATPQHVEEMVSNECVGASPVRCSRLKFDATCRWRGHRDDVCCWCSPLRGWTW